MNNNQIEMNLNQRRDSSGIFELVEGVENPPSIHPQQQQQKKKRKKKKKKHKIPEGNLFEMHSTPTAVPLPLSFTSESLDIDSPIWLNEEYINDHRLEEEHLEDDINMTVEQSHSSPQIEKKKNVDLPEADLILEKIINVLHEFEQKLQVQINSLELKFDRKLDQLSQKVDNLYERGAASSVMFHFSIHHYLDTPMSPCSRLFDSHYSKQTKLLFGYFAQEMHQRYFNLWKNPYEQMGVSLRPEQIEIDLLGFAHEQNTKKNIIFNSPKMEPLQSNSSYSFIQPFKANTIIIGEVTTAIVDFDHQQLVRLEQSHSKSLNINVPTYALCRKLMQLERILNFILIYFNGAKLENLLVALVGRFHHRRYPQQVYKLVFQSTFSNKIPLLNRLYELEHEEKNKQLYFIS